MFLSRSQPSIVSPIAYMSMVVDCMRVEPASAMYPTLQLIFKILSDWINSLDLSTFSTRIQSVLPQRMQGFLLESSTAFQTAPITHEVSPPSVLPISRSFSWNPSSTRCCCANSGWSSKSYTDLMRAASPPAMKAITFSLHSGRISFVSCLQRVSSTIDNLPVAPHPQTKILPPVFKASFTASAIAYNSSILVNKMLIVSISNPLIISIARLRSFCAS